MKPILFPLLLCSALVIVGCQKEPSVELSENTLPGESADGTRLKRLVYQFSVNDSAYTDFFYDAAGRWIGQRTVGDALLTESAEINVTRASNGIITSYRVTEDDGNGQDETTVYRVYYDAAAQRYTSKVTEFQAGSDIVIDSTVFTINNGRMTSQRFLYKDKRSGLAAEIGRIEFTYNSAGNPMTATTSASNISQGGTSRPVSEVTIDYDNRVNPLNMGVEGLVLDQIFFATANNITRLSFKDLVNPANSDDLITLNYAYHSSGKPRSAEVSADGVATNIYFRYQ